MQTHSRLNIEALLSHLPLFNGLAVEEISRIALATSEIRAEKGEILFHKGHPCDGFHLLVFGQVKLAFTSAQGAEKVIEIVREGQSFGEAVMFMDKPYIVYAQALADSLLLHVAKSAIYGELDRDPRFARKMLAGMAMRLHQLIGDVESYSLHSGTQRVIGYLLRELPEGDGGRDVVICLDTSKGIIASRLNLTQEHFSRILHELVRLGLIVVSGRKICIPDVARLRGHTG